MENLLVAAIIFLAVFIQSVAGFGVALVSMAILPGLVGVKVAAPLVALVALTIEIILLWRYKAALNLRAIWQVVIASLFGVPFGIFALRSLEEGVILFALGIVVASYAVYGLLNLKLPKLAHPTWAYGLGFIAGMLGGAYNTSGPPVIIYGASRGWLPSEFKGNLQGFFLINSLVIVFSHAFAQSFTQGIWRLYVLSIPAVAIGLLAGYFMDRYIDAEVFRKIVLILLIVMGVRLMF